MATPAAHSFPIAVPFAALTAVIGSAGLPLPSSAGDEDFHAALARLRSDPDAKAFLATTFTVTHTPYSPRNLEKNNVADEHPEVVSQLRAELIEAFEAQQQHPPPERADW